MRTVGQILKEKRLEYGFVLDQVEKNTKIRTKFISAIEADDYRKLPPSPYIEGFLKNYADFLGLRSETILAIFRRQYALKSKINKTKVEEPLKQSNWQLTPNKAIFVSVIIVILILFGYFYNQFRLLHTPPPLNLESPKADMVTKETKIAIFGDTDRDATLTINNEPVLVKSDGKFFKEIDINIGNNTLLVEAKSRVGEKTIVVRRLTRISD